MALVLAFAGLVAVVVWLYCLLDAVTTPGSAVRTFPKAGWVAIIAVFFVFGALAWLWLGRPAQEVADGDAGGPGTPPAEPPKQPGPGWPPAPPPGHGGPVGPDDDPEFLRRLGRRRDDDRDDPDA